MTHHISAPGPGSSLGLGALLAPPTAAQYLVADKEGRADRGPVIPGSRLNVDLLEGRPLPDLAVRGAVQCNPSSQAEWHAFGPHLAALRRWRSFLAAPRGDSLVKIVQHVEERFFQ